VRAKSFTRTSTLDRELSGSVETAFGAGVWGCVTSNP